MKTPTQKRWRAHVAAWSSSGSTCKEYAAKAGINPRTLTWWKSKLKGAEATADMPEFVEVTEPCASAAVAEEGGSEVEVGDAGFVVRGRDDTEALARVLAAVEARR